MTGICPAVDEWTYINHCLVYPECEVGRWKADGLVEIWWRFIKK